MARILVENTLSTRLLFSPKMLRPRLACPKNVSVKFVVFSLSRNGREFDKETLDFSSEFTATCHRVLIPLLLRVRRTSLLIPIKQTRVHAVKSHTSTRDKAGKNGIFVKPNASDKRVVRLQR